MKISELLRDVRFNAETYRQDADQTYYKLSSDELTDAFNWDTTKEGYYYWKKMFYAPASGKPEQYQIGIDTFERSEANMTKEEILACCRFNIDKYNWRKKDQDLSDFKKIIDYAKFAIKQIEKND